MISKRSTAGLAAAALLLSLANPALANGQGHKRGGPLYDYAKGISSRPIIRYVTVKTPVEECWEDVEYYTVNHRPPGEGARTLVGAVLGGVIGHQYLANARDRSGCFPDRAAIGARHQNVNVRAHDLCRGNRVQGGALQAAVVVFCNYQGTHQITFASFFSLSTS